MRDREMNSSLSDASRLLAIREHRGSRLLYPQTLFFLGHLDRLIDLFGPDVP